MLILHNVDDGVNLVKQIARDGNFVPGAGAFEIEVARRLSSFADSTPGLEQYAIRKFAEALEVIPRTLAENAGLTATDVISSLYAAHSAGETTKGVNIEVCCPLRCVTESLQSKNRPFLFQSTQVHIFTHCS